MFTTVSYVFRIDEADGDLAGIAKSYLNSIDEVINKSLPGIGILKERAGNVGNHSNEAGDTRRELVMDITLKYRIRMADEGKPNDLATLLSTLDIKYDGVLLAVYDDLIAHLRISKDKKIIRVMGQMDSLRRNDFEVGAYLKLSCSRQHWSTSRSL